LTDKFPADASQAKVLKAYESLGFRVVREAEHIALVRVNPDGTRTPMSVPNHRKLKSSTLRTICGKARIPREDFIEAFKKS
jgi:hypothetical protein